MCHQHAALMMSLQEGAFWAHFLNNTSLWSLAFMEMPFFFFFNSVQSPGIPQSNYSFRESLLVA